MSIEKKLRITGRTKVNRLPKRASYDINTIRNILDSSFICHLGFSIEGQTFVIPTCYGRQEDKIYFHGAKGSRMLKHLKNDSGICITITLLDGIVLAKSAFHHSINYRSVVIFGNPEEIVNTDDKEKALEIITEHIIPGRWKDTRLPNQKELNATSVFSLTINEASSKIREGGPIDEEEDLTLKVWSGVLPLKTFAGEPVKFEGTMGDIPIPDYIKNFTC